LIKPHAAQKNFNRAFDARYINKINRHHSNKKFNSKNLPINPFYYPLHGVYNIYMKRSQFHVFLGVDIRNAHNMISCSFVQPLHNVV